MKRLSGINSGLCGLLFIFSMMSLGYTEQVSGQTASPPKLHFWIEGNGTLNRSRQTGYIPVSIGAKIQRGDLIAPADGQTVKILCADLSLHLLNRNSPCTCSDDQGDIVYDGWKMSRPMGVGSAIPYILQPRRTAILGQKPLLKWYDTGASSYTVKLVDEAINVVWQANNVTLNQIEYPGKPQLQPGKTYLLKVIDNDTGDHSGKDLMKGIGFQLLDDESIKTIDLYAKKIQALDLNEKSQIFAIAVYYATQGVYGEALSLLENISSDLSTPAVHVWRGHMYGAMRLAAEAETAYTQALELAEAEGDLYTQAEAAGGLWCITRNQQYHDAAVQLHHTMGIPESEIISICKE